MNAGLATDLRKTDNVTPEDAVTRDPAAADVRQYSSGQAQGCAGLVAILSRTN
jgi:hypothetical protein